MPTRREALVAGLSAATVGYVGAVMSDRPDFQRSQDIADQSLPEQDTAVTTERARDVKSLNQRPGGNVPDNRTEQVRFRPPKGTVFELRSVFIDIQFTGGSTQHSVAVTIEDVDFGPVLSAIYPGSAGMDIEGCVVANRSQANEVTPGSEEAQVAACQSLAVDNDGAIEVSYFNGSGQPNTAPRSYTVLVDQIDIE